jgi:hypothetical protein
MLGNVDLNWLDSNVRECGLKLAGLKCWGIWIRISWVEMLGNVDLYLKLGSNVRECGLKLAWLNLRECGLKLAGFKC